jgi:methylated-DNA-[protein]-cysteine S-methyltransferase
MTTTLYWHHPSPLGRLLFTSDGEALTGIFMEDHKRGPAALPDWREDSTPFTETIRQLDAYFAGERTAFDVPLAPRGTPFQKRVWAALQEIPFGQTRSYAELAQAVGMPGAARAVGSANARNPLSIVVPCHRVVATSGALTGYAGGVERKQWLLAHERRPRGACPDTGWLPPPAS